MAQVRKVIKIDVKPHKPQALRGPNGSVSVQRGRKTERQSSHSEITSGYQRYRSKGNTQKSIHMRNRPFIGCNPLKPQIIVVVYENVRVTSPRCVYKKCISGINLGYRFVNQEG